MPKVAIIQKYIPHYRRDFFNQLHEALGLRNIELLLIYGQPNKEESFRNDAIDLDWATKVPNRILSLGRKDLYWQPVLPYLKGVDLVIVEQASKLLINYPLLLMNSIGMKKVAFWGHGKNMQEDSASRLGEWLKKRVSSHVHWWFAYTESSVEIVKGLGYPGERITNVQNAIDTLSLNKAFHSLSDDEIQMVRTAPHLQSHQTGLYIGGFYPGKNLAFLLESLDLIKQQLSDFEMLFIGDGVEALKIQQAAKTRPWIHAIGPKFDQEKLPYFAISKVLLIPFTVGLAVLDSFALETPLITIDSPFHGPEISYLQNMINGLMVESPCTPEKYANRVVEVMQNQKEYDNIVAQCKISLKTLTLENMVTNFVNGIEKALASKA